MLVTSRGKRVHFPLYLLHIFLQIGFENLILDQGNKFDLN